MKQILNRIFSRITLTGLFILLQLLALYALIFMLGTAKVAASYFYALCEITAVLLVLRILYKNDNPAYKIAWIIPILLFPLFGGLLYIVFGKVRLSAVEKQRMDAVGRRYQRAMEKEPEAEEALEKASPDAALMSRYIRYASGTPPYRDTETLYLPVGEVFYENLLRELKQAKKFIFCEYYIIREGKMWDSVHAILKEKAAAGVDVRVIYDDFGAMFKLKENTDKLLEKEGIRCCVFNRLSPVLSVRFNNRDHRKICVIDGNVGFTGGINIADEYINAAPRCGHWLDSAVMLRGRGVWALTSMFLSVWDFLRKENTDINECRPDPAFLATVQGQGFVQPFSDTPLDNEPCGETVYRNMLERSKKYVYINTPYLIIDNEMLTSLTTAAKCGIDVRIVTPAICDSKIVQEMTRSFYEALIEGGVRIYEYQPGMVHSKTFISDDSFGVVGTINLDYRSLYLHYECAAWMYGAAAVPQMKSAYEQELLHCRQISLEECKEQSRFKHLYRAVLRAFAPLF